MLSPFLFAIYLDDLAALCKPERKLLIALYADDILLLAPTLTALQKLLHDCERELDLIDMAINFKKCSCLRIGQRFDVASANPFNVKLNLNILEFTLFVLRVQMFVNC